MSFLFIYFLPEDVKYWIEMGVFIISLSEHSIKHRNNILSKDKNDKKDLLVHFVFY